LRRMRVFVRTTEIAGVEARLTANPPSFQVRFSAGNPTSVDCRDSVSKTESYQPRQVSSCWDIGNEWVVNFSGVTVFPHPYLGNRMLHDEIAGTHLISHSNIAKPWKEGA
jgi:hypothetical protein